MFVDNFRPIELHTDKVSKTVRAISYLAKVADDNGIDLYFVLDPTNPLKHSSSAAIELAIRMMKTLDVRPRTVELWDGL
ncbi:hypothetical protein NW754_004072 [Fusarium falciforme]|nr:hypothetical protein NW754_004072 [Fusarium falciforme]